MDIDTTRIKYTDFASKESYCKLQEFFGGYDDKGEYSEINEPLEDFQIILLIRDEFGFNEDYLEKGFLKDFLEPGIDEMRDRYFEDFRRAVEVKAILTAEVKREFLKLYRNKILNYKEEINANETLNNRIIVALDQSLVELEELLVEYMNEDPYPKIKEKIQFKWKRADVEYFFHLLREKEEIFWIADVDLGNIIDGVFQYRDDEGNVKDIKGSNRHITDYKNDDPGRNKIYPHNRLKKVFLEIF